MNQKLTGKQYALLASMLFGMFFGAGNLIFPIILGAKAGASLVPALLGMLITAVGMPLLGIVALGVSGSGHRSLQLPILVPYPVYQTVRHYPVLHSLFYSAFGVYSVNCHR